MDRGYLEYRANVSERNHNLIVIVLLLIFIYFMTNIYMNYSDVSRNMVKATNPLIA